MTTDSGRYLERRFLTSIYTALALAAAALSWSLRDLVPGIPMIAAIVTCLVLFAYALEGRWTLSLAAANIAGTVIAIGIGIWLIRESLRSAPQGAMASMPWPTSLVPMLGPVLLVLIPAKLLRPKKTPDYWGLHLIGLACVGLGSAMTDDEIFGILLLLYIIAAMWSLALFFPYREIVTTRAMAAQILDSRTILLPRSSQLMSWTVPVLGLALIGFMFLPRSQNRWQIPTETSKSMESGVSEEAKIDLHRTGALSLDNEVVLEVRAAYRDGTPKLDLPADQRWRGQVYRHYERGEWQRTPKGSSAPQQPRAVATADMPREVTLPDFGRDDQYYLTYFVRAPLGPVAVVSDPVYRSGPNLPVVTLYPDGRLGAWSTDLEGTLRIRDKIVPGKTRYWQVTVPPPAPGVSHPVELNPALSDLRRPANLPELTAWTESLLERLVASGRLSDSVLKQRSAGGSIDPIHHFQVAKALEEFLSHSGEYTYSLNLERRNTALDPTLDFLFYTKSGHCNRFASALALMLRSLRIPCQVVTGFRGADSYGDGTYVIRQCHAHTWVEALVYVQQPSPAHGLHHGDESWHWVTLDPTPPDAVMEASAVSSRFFGLDWDPRRLYRNLIVGYTPENRNEFFNDIAKATRAAWLTFRQEIMASTPQGFRLRLALGLVFAVIVVSSFMVLRWLRARLSRWGVWVIPARSSRFYHQMLRVLARRGLRPTPSQTPREFLDHLSRCWADRSVVAEIVRLIKPNVELYYRQRFGGDRISPRELIDAEDRVRRLRMVLSGRIENSG
jgi:hypothetical protein